MGCFLLFQLTLLDFVASNPRWLPFPTGSSLSATISSSFRLLFVDSDMVICYVSNNFQRWSAGGATSGGKLGPFSA